MRSVRAQGGGLVRFLASIAFFTLAFADPARLFADGPSRPATAKEEEFHARIAGTFAKVLPPGPAGWDEERENIQPVGRVIPDAEKYPFQVSYRASWTDRRKREEAQRKQMEAFSKIAATPDPELQELARRGDKLAAEMGAAMGKGDQATAMRLNREMEELQAKMNKRKAIQDAKFKEVQEATSPRDAAISIALSANTFSETFYRDGAAEAPVGGGLVYRTKGEPNADGSWNEGTTFVFLGKGWQLKKDGGTWMEAPQRPGAPSLAVQAIIVRVEADAARARDVLGRFDWASLQKLLAN